MIPCISIAWFSNGSSQWVIVFDKWLRVGHTAQWNHDHAFVTDIFILLSGFRYWSRQKVEAVCLVPCNNWTQLWVSQLGKALFWGLTNIDIWCKGSNRFPIFPNILRAHHIHPGFLLRVGCRWNFQVENEVIVRRIWSEISNSKVLCKSWVKFVCRGARSGTKQSLLSLTNSQQPWLTRSSCSWCN